MLPILDLIPDDRHDRVDRDVWRLVPLQPKFAGRPKQVWADLALFEWGDEDALGTTGQEPRQIGLTDRKRKLPHVIAVAGQHVEGVELDFLVMLSGMQASKSDRPSKPRMTASPSMTKCFCRIFSADSTIQG
jgi:hypothetical protein